MFNKIVWFISLRYWRVKGIDSFGKLVSNLASIGIILGIIALIIVLSVMNGLENTQKERILKTIPHALVNLKNNNFDYNQNYFDKLDPVIQAIEPTNISNVVLQSNKNATAGRLIGINAKTHDPNIVVNNYDLNTILSTKSYQMIISSQLAMELNIEKWQKIRLLITESSQYTPFGRVPIQRLFTVINFFDANNDVDKYQIYANIEDVGNLLRISPTQYQSYRLYLKDPFKINTLSTIFENSKYNIKDWREQKGEFFQAVKMEKNMMGLLVSLIIIVAISNILTSLSLMVVDKQNEIAILQTQGLTKKQVLGIFITQGLLVSIISTIIGIILGVIFTYNINYINYILRLKDIELPTIINPMQIIIIAGFSLLSALLTIIYPSFRAAAIDPAETLRYE